MPAQLPSDFASQLLYSNYIKALADPPATGHNDSLLEQAQHDAFHAIFPRSTATKVYAANSGLWSTAANWYPNGVPGAGDNVLIGEGVVVTYDVNAPATVLGRLRNDGEFHFAKTVNTAIHLDTEIHTATSKWSRGTTANPIVAAYTSETIWANNGPINIATDPWMMSRGSLWHGDVDQCGAEKVPFLHAKTHLIPALGATSVAVSEEPVGWQNGDRVLLSGNRLLGSDYLGGAWNGLQYYGRLCEERIITGIALVGSDWIVSWTDPLIYSHVPPPHDLPGLVLRILICNLSRNIVYRPAAPQNIGNGTPFTGSAAYLPQMAAGDGKGMERPHTMFMHSGSVDFRWFEIRNAGRTSKFTLEWALCKNKSASAGGTITLDGPYVVGGVVKADGLFQICSDLGSGQTQWAGLSQITVTGTGPDGNPQTEVGLPNVQYFHGEKLWMPGTAITITSSNAITGATFGIRMRSFQMTENGVKNRHEKAAQWFEDPLTYVTFDTLTNQHNLQGRYPLHMHKIGHGDYHNLAVIEGGVVSESPGWGFTQHSTHGLIRKCIAYDCFGAGFVAEAGDETGLWEEYACVSGRHNADVTHKSGLDAIALDPARSGPGSWFTGRAVKVSGVYGSDLMSLVVYNTRVREIEMRAEQFDLPDVLRGALTTTIDHHPITHFRNMEASATAICFEVVKANADQHHDWNTVLDGAVCWSCAVGVVVTYTQHYRFKNMDVVGGYLSNGGVPYFGVGAEVNSSDQTFRNIRVSGFRFGLQLDHFHTEHSDQQGLTGYAFRYNERNARTTYDITVTSTVPGSSIIQGVERVHGRYLDPDPAIDDLDLDSADLGSGVSLTLNVPRPVWPAFGGLQSYIYGTKTDEHEARPYPFGTDTYEFRVYEMRLILAARGYYNNTPDNKKYTHMLEVFSNFHGEPFIKVIPVEVAEYELATATFKGNCNLDSNVGPVLADFTVTTGIGESIDVDVIARATHAGGRPILYGGNTSPFHSFIEKNGDGTITIHPVPDFPGTETFFVFVYDPDGNQARATVTVITQEAELTQFLQAGVRPMLRLR
jgi:hypothetical protein